MYNKENLVFSNVSDNSYFYNLWLSPYANYDVFINYNGNKEDSKLNWLSSINGISKQQGYTYNILNTLYKNNNIDLNKYKYIAILDDSSLIERYEISMCFELMNNYDLFCGSPSFEKEENLSNQLFMHDKHSKLRFTNLIDSRIVFIRADILKKALDIYKNELENYGIEHLLVKDIHEFKNKIGIFDTICTSIKNKIEYTTEQKDKFVNYLLSGTIYKIDMIIYSNLCKKNSNYPNINDIKNNDLILTKSNYVLEESALKDLDEITKNAHNKELEDNNEENFTFQENLNLHKVLDKQLDKQLDKSNIIFNNNEELHKAIKETVKEIITEVNVKKATKKTIIKKQTANKKFVKTIGLVKKFYKSLSVKKSSKKVTKKHSVKLQSVKKKSVKNKVENKKVTHHTKVKLI